MNRKIFWVIIEATLENSNDQLELQEKLLKDMLKKFDQKQLNTFQNIAEDFINNLFFESFFAAAYLLQKSITHDSIIAFAGWVISRGESTYRNVINNPDCLHDILQAKPLHYKTQLSIDLLAPEINRDLFDIPQQYKKYNLQNQVDQSGFLQFLDPHNPPALQNWLLRKIPKLTAAYFELD